MAIDFPNSPTIGDTFTVGNRTWEWNGTKWSLQTTAIENFTVSDTAPNSPTVGDLWFNSSNAATYIYYDSAWVEVGGATVSDWSSINRNVIINGAMNVAQRGTSTSDVTSSGYYTADRWYVILSSLGTWTQSVENDAPTGSGFRKSLKMLCTTADASPDASNACFIQYRIEGQDVQHFAKGTPSAKQVSLSFWVKSNVTGTHICELTDIDNGRQVSASYTISASGTWEKKTFTFPADITGVIDDENTWSVAANFFLGAGSNYTSGTLNTTWASTVTANRAVGQSNVASAADNYLQITGVQLEPGPVATPFEFEDYGTTLLKCQRYYYRLSNSGVYGHHSTATPASSTTNCRAILVNPVTMRISASAIETNGVILYDGVNVIGPSAITLDGGLTSPGYTVVNATVTGATQFRPYSIINSDNAGHYIGVSAEL
jgi:hypothetical protein